MSNQPGLWDAPAPVPTPEPDLVPLDAYGATPDHVEVPADYIPVDYEPAAPVVCVLITNTPPRNPSPRAFTPLTC